MQLTIYENKFLSKSTSLSMSMMGSMGAPNSLNVRATLSSSGSGCFSSGISIYAIDARRTASEQLMSQGTHTLHVPVALDMCCCNVDTVRFLVTQVLPTNRRWCTSGRGSVTNRIYDDGAIHGWSTYAK